MHVRRATQDDRAWIAEVVVGAFASTRVVSRGRVHDDAAMLDGFVVENDGRPVGCALWHEVEGDAELVVIVTTYRGAGAGTALLDAVVDHARAHVDQFSNDWTPPVLQPRRGLAERLGARTGYGHPVVVFVAAMLASM